MNYKFFLICCGLVITQAHGSAQVYQRPFFPYYSQCGQDQYLNEDIFHNKRNGVFIDIGAHDGISFSNTYFFEQNLGWTGICIEPHPDRYKELRANRTSICLQACVANYNGKGEFLKISGAPEMLSGLNDAYDPRHEARINYELAQNGGSAEVLEVDVYTLATILEKYGVTKIDFLSVDTEGSEFLILSSIDLKTIDIAYIVVENNYEDNLIHNYLISNNYRHIKKVGGDDVYQKITM